MTKILLTHKSTFRCTAMEKAVLQNNATRCGLTLSEYCRQTSLGIVPKERYTEEELQLLRDVAYIRGSLQRLNNFFKAKNFEGIKAENARLITELNKLFH